MIQALLWVALAAADGGSAVALEVPWVTVKGAGFSFEFPEAVQPIVSDEDEPDIGKYQATRWKTKLGEEKLLVACMVGPTVASPKAISALIAQFSGMPGVKIAQARLPNGATECTISGTFIGRVRLFPMDGQTCVVGAMRATGATTPTALRFVDSFVRAKGR